MFLNIHKVYIKKLVPAACNYIKKETLVQVFEFRETLKDTCGGCFWSFLLRWSSLHFILKWQDWKNFTKLVPSDIFLGFTKLNPKAVTRMCSIKTLFLEISENFQKQICARVLYYIDENWNHFIKEYLEQFSKKTHFGRPKQWRKC